MKNHPSGISSLYRSTPNSHNTCRLAFTLNEPVDPRALRKGVDTAMERYDYLSVRLVREEGDPLHTVVPNPKPVPVVQGARGVTLLTPEADFHTVAVAYEGEQVFFDFLHALITGAAMVEFAKTVLYYYIAEKYGRPLPGQDILTLEDPVTDEERLDPYLDPPAPAAAPSGGAGGGGIPSPALDLSRFVAMDPSRQTSYRMTVGEDAFMTYCRANQGTPATMTAALLARTLYRLCDRMDAPARFVLMKRYHEALGVPAAHSNVLGNVILQFTEAERDLDPAKLCAMARSMLALQSDREVILSAVQRRLGQEAQVLALGDYRAIRAAFQQAASRYPNLLNMTISYVGKTKLGALEPYVRALYTYVDPAASGVLVELNAVNGLFCFTFLQNFAGDGLVRAFAAELAQAGLSAELGPEEPPLYPRMELD